MEQKNTFQRRLIQIDSKSKKKEPFQYNSISKNLPLKEDLFAQTPDGISLSDGGLLCLCGLRVFFGKPSLSAFSMCGPER